MERDPVCGKELELKDIQFQSFHEEKMYSFDSYGCKKLFEAAPEKYYTYYASTAIEDTATTKAENTGKRYPASPASGRASGRRPENTRKGQRKRWVR